MGKAILVMDMPSKCRECPLHISLAKIDTFCSKTMKSIKYEEFYTTKPSWCPLREVPQKKDTTSIHPELHEVDVRLGYNKCIDEILGKDV